MSSSISSTAILTTLTFTPHTSDKPGDERNAGTPADLFACADTGQFYTVAQMHLDITPRSSRHAKRFYCPVCPDSTVTLTARGEAPAFIPGPSVAYCPTCRWDAAGAGIHSVSDLLQRDADPYPALTMHFRQLRAQLSSTRAAVVGTGVRQTRPTDTTSSATAFTALQADRETEVFASFLPKRAEISLTRHSPTTQAELCGTVDSTTLLPSAQRVTASGLARKIQPARRRVPPARLAVRSPFAPAIARPDWETLLTNRAARPRGTAARVLPDLTMEMDECADETCVAVTVRNHAARHVQIGMNAVQGTPSVLANLAPGASSTLRMPGFVMKKRRSMDERECDRVVEAMLFVRYECNGAEDWVGRHVWRAQVYARHVRRKTCGGVV